MGARILNETLREPAGKISDGINRGVLVDLQSDLFLSVLDGVRAVTDITANSKGVVATDGAYDKFSARE